MRRKEAIVTGCALGALALAIFLPRLAAELQARRAQPARIGLESPEECQWLVVVLRRKERDSESETGIPFRNSLLALYEKDGDAWRKRSRDYLARSTTTSLNPPAPTDEETVVRYVQDKKVDYTYGYASVPPGVYRLTRAGSFNPAAEVQSDWFLLSDWNARGTILLPEPQIIRHCGVENAAWPEKPRVVDLPTSTTTRVKVDCYLHGTGTRFWSHRDSKGCINLFLHPQEREVSDWGQFTADLKKSGVWDEKAKLGLALIAETATPLDSEDRLPQALAIRFRLENGKFQADIKGAEP